jgi:hypothetical protein
MLKNDNMTKIELENILSQKNNLKNLPNNLLVEFLDKLSSDFESTKETIISLTYHIDKVEEIYNFVLKEYQTRVNEQTK